MSNQVWLTEYGMDCFSVGSIGEEEGGTVPNDELLAKWWPLYIDGKQVGWTMLEFRRRTCCFGIRVMDGHSVEIRTDGAVASDDD